VKKPEPGANGWYEIVGKGARVDLWIELECDGPEELPDGRWLEREVAFGRGDQYPARWWFRQQEPCRASRLADVLWGAVAAFCVVSERFIEVIGELGVTGWSTYPITILDRRDNPIDGYLGFVPPLTGGQGLRSSGWKKRTPSGTFYVTERILDGLLAEGVDLFDIWPAEKKYAPPPFQSGDDGAS